MKDSEYVGSVVIPEMRLEDQWIAVVGLAQKGPVVPLADLQAHAFPSKEEADGFAADQAVPTHVSRLERP